ncbi:MAG: PAS domain S-box protein, partial [Deltaproteobacteria bacterium]|nr:PAS domain S-box protein [Deltaproteobacteria bacterium]
MNSDSRQILSREEILVVEDNATDRKLLVDILTNAGYHVRPADNGDLALRSVQAKLPDLVLLDVKLPGLDGIEVCRRLKDNPKTSNLPVIFISALDEVELKVKALETGGIDYVCKPIESAEVLARINTHISMYRLQQKLADQTVVLSSEIVERKQTQEALTESEERLRTMFEQSPFGIALIDSLTGDIYEVNQSFAEIAGRTREEIVNIDWMSITHPDDIQEDLENMAKLNAGKVDGFKMNKRYLHPDGTAVWIKMTVAPVKVADKAHPRHLCMIEDISEIKKSEKTREAERERMGEILSSMDAGLYLLNPDMTIAWVNDKIKDMFPGKDPYGMLCHGFIESNDQPCPQCPSIAAFQEGRTLELEKSNESNGRWYHITSQPVKDESGRTANVLVGIRDITKQKLMAAEASRSAHLASIGELAAGVAHEINNPINGIINYAQMLVDRSDKNLEMNEIPALIIEEGERIAGIVKNLLSFSRQQNEEHSPIRIADVIANTLSLVEKQLFKDGIRLLVDVPEGLPKIKARGQQIQQVFMNIASNARYALNQKIFENHDEKFLNIKCELIELDSRKIIRTI